MVVERLVLSLTMRDANSCSCSPNNSSTAMLSRFRANTDPSELTNVAVASTDRVLLSSLTNCDPIRALAIVSASLPKEFELPTAPRKDATMSCSRLFFSKEDNFDPSIDGKTKLSSSVNEILADTELMTGCEPMD